MLSSGPLAPKYHRKFPGFGRWLRRDDRRNRGAGTVHLCQSRLAALPCQGSVPMPDCNHYPNVRDSLGQLFSTIPLRCGIRTFSIGLIRLVLRPGHLVHFEETGISRFGLLIPNRPRRQFQVILEYSAKDAWCFRTTLKCRFLSGTGIVRR